MSHQALPGAAIFYELAGCHEPNGRGRQSLVFVHGGGCDHRDWRHQAEALAGDFTVLTLDLRGHGRSTGTLADCTVERWAADVNALIDALGLGPAVIVGHSLGSRIAAEAAWRQPANTAALILLDGSRSVGGFAASEPSAAAVPPPLGDPSLAAVIEATIGPHADEATRRQVMATMSAASLDLLQRTVAAYTAWDADRADLVLAGLAGAKPVLAIQSTYHDRFTPRRSLAPGETTPYLDFLKCALPQLEVRILPQTGHFAMLERPAEITRLIRDFAARAADRAE